MKERRRDEKRVRPEEKEKKNGHNGDNVYEIVPR